MDGLEKTLETKEGDETLSFKKFFYPLTNVKAFTLFTIFGFVVFSNALFNDFVADDKTYIINDQTTHLLNLLSAFTRNNFNGYGQYRPISAVYFSVLYNIFGNFSFFYHFFQLIFYLIAAFLLYIVFKKFFPTVIAFILSLFFLVHPMNVESASYIAQTDNPLFFILGLIPLLIFMKKEVSSKKIGIALLLLLFSVLTKETGVLFIIIISIYLFLFNRKHLIKFLLGAGLVICMYAFMRFVIGQVYFETRTLTPIADLPLLQRLINIPAIIFYYLKTVSFPTSLDFNQQWIITKIHFSTFYLPLIIDLCFFSFVGLLGFLVRKYHNKHTKIYILFLLWFFIGLISTLQIFPLDMTVSDRWFYFPMVGLLGILGILINNYIFTKEKLKKSFIIIVVTLIVLLSVRTMMRNTNFRNNLTLLTHDSQIDDNFAVENSLGTEYKRLGNNNMSLIHLKKSAKLRPNEYNLLNIGIVYEDLGDIPRAKVYYKKAMQAPKYNMFDSHKHDLETYIRFASILVFYDKPINALPPIQEGIQDYANYTAASELLLDLALVKYELHDKQGALDAISSLYVTDPMNEQIENLYKSIQANKPITVVHNNKTFIFKNF
jgi:hypothetical protein